MSPASATKFGMTSRANSFEVQTQRGSHVTATSTGHQKTLALLAMLLGACAFEPVSSIQQAADLPSDIVSSAVGSIPYTTNVDDQGRLHVDVPLVLPPGRQGIEPSLSLHYDSSAGDSLVGTGWSLRGLSRLHRCFHRAEMADAPYRASTNGYCLDGVPLDRSADGFYRTLPDTHVRIEQLEAADEWIVHELSGRKMVFGGTSDSIQRDAFGEPTAWHLSTVRDDWGNFYRITYGNESVPAGNVINEGVFLRPLSISYTHHPSREATRRIDFVYETELSAPRSHWERASHQLRSKVLSAIRVFAVRETVGVGAPIPSLQPVSDYRLEHHEFAVSAARVTAIKHCAYSVGTTMPADATCLPPLTFSYDVVRGDVQGWDESEADRPRAVDVTTRQTIPGDPTIFPVAVGNFDSEPGEEFLLVRGPDGEPLFDEVEDWRDGGYLWIAKPDLSGSGEEQLVPTDVRYAGGAYAAFATSNPEFNRVVSMNPLVVDVNSDGLDDLLQWSHENSGLRVLMNEGATFVPYGIHPTEFTSVPLFSFIVDAMGDSRSEIVFCREDPTRPDISETLPAFTWSIAAASIHEPKVVHTDIPCYPPEPRLCPLGTQGITTMSGTMNAACAYGGEMRSPTIADFNGDGVVEWLVWNGDERSPAGMYVWSADSSRLVRSGPVVQGEDSSSWSELTDDELTLKYLDDGVDAASEPFKVVDLNGDGYPDIVSFVPTHHTLLGCERGDFVVHGYIEVRWGIGERPVGSGGGYWFSEPRALPSAFEITDKEFRRAFFDDVDGNGAGDLIGAFVVGDEFGNRAYEDDALGMRWLVLSGSTMGLRYSTVAADPAFLLMPNPLWAVCTGHRPEPARRFAFDGDGDGARRHTVWGVTGSTDAWQISRFPEPKVWVLTGVTQTRNDTRIAHSRKYRWGFLEDPDLHTPSTDVRCVEADTEGGHAAGRTECLRRGGPVVRESWIEYLDAAGQHEAPWMRERFRYEGALFDRFERRPIGFERRIVENLEAGTRTTFEYDPWTTLPSRGRPRLRAGVPLTTKTEVFQRTTNDGLVEASRVFERLVVRETETLDSGGTYFVYPRFETTTETTDGEQTFTSTRETRLDTRGLVRETRFEVGGEQVDTTEFDYAFFDTAYRAAPDNVTRTRCRMMRCSTTVEDLNWVSLTGAAEGPIVLAHRRVRNVDSSERYDYIAYNEGWNELGQATRLRETVEGPARFTERTTHFVFEDHDAFAPTTVRNALGHEGRITHHPVWGRPSQTVDANGFRVDWRYDGFGRMREVHSPTIGMRRTIVESELPDGTFEQRIARDGYTMGRSISDGLGRIRQSAERVPGGDLVNATTEYDSRTGLPVSAGLALPGRARDVVAYTPEVPLGPGERWTAELGRPRRLTNALNGVTRVEYAGRTIRTTDPRGGLSIEVYGTDGLLRSATDPATSAGTATTTYEYDEHEALRVTTDALGFEYLVERDRFGRVIEAHHPDSGYDEVEYDAWGLPTFVVHRPTGIRYTSEFDELGRTTELVARRGTVEERSTWEYDDAANGIGLLWQSTSSDGVVETLGYESGGLLRERTVVVDGRSYRTRIRQRGRDGQIERLDVPQGATGAVRSIGYQYDSPGFLRAVGAYGSTDPWWERVEVAADGQTTLERFHATSVGTDHYPETGLVKEVAFQAGATLLGRYAYDYDPDGRLKWREQRSWVGSPDSRRREELTYDDRGQLERVQLKNPAGFVLQERSYSYDVLGNLQTAVRPSGTRQYVRDAAYPHRTDRTTGHDPRDLTYDDRGQVTSSGTATVTYDLFGRPKSITEPSSRGSRQFAYDAAGNLVRTSSSKGIAYRPDAMTEEVVGGGGYVLHRIGGENLSGALVRSSGVGGSTDRMISQVLVAPASAAMTLDGTTVMENYSFDEWGTPRGADWTSPSAGGGTAGMAGFASHLHAGVDPMLTRFQHMGARLYDRDLGLMTSPDPITNPRRALDLNPFAYAWNDPLNVLDPTGMNEYPEFGAVAVVDVGGYPFLEGPPPDLAAVLGWAESLVESACGGAAMCRFDGFGVGHQFVARAFTPISNGSPTGRSRPPSRPRAAPSRPDASGRPRHPTASLVETPPPARRARQSALENLFTLADGVASGLNPFDEHRTGPVENGDPTLWNVGRAFGAGAGVVGDLALMAHGSQTIGGGGAVAATGAPVVGAAGAVGVAVGVLEVAAGAFMLPRHAQVLGASITQMSRPPRARGARPSAAFPRSNLRGVSIRWLRRNKPRGWREVPTAHNEGWIWVDENGVERLRYMRPNGSTPGGSQFSRQADGYFRWKDADGNLLDVDGNIVDKASLGRDEYEWLTHIPYEGVP